MAADTTPAGLLRIAELTKRYGRLTALADVSFSVRPGEVLGLIGPNGAGKTTLFECLAGVLPADRGDGAIDGARADSARQRRRSSSTCPDAIAPWPAQTVGWALDFASASSAADAARRDEVDRAAGSRRRCSTRRSARCRRASASARCSRSAC